MNKLITLLTISLLLFPIISAVDFEIKSDYSQGETLISKFSGNFVDSVTEDNIKFYRGHVRVSIEPHLTKIGEEYYLYALLPENEANYSVRIEDATYMRGSQTIEEDIIRNFTISNSTADFSVDPGFITTADDFTLIMQNLQDTAIKITLSIETETGNEGNYYSSTLGTFEESTSKSISIISGKEEKIDFRVNGVEEDSFKKINLYTNGTSYEIPFYALATALSNKKEKSLRFSADELQVKIPTGEQLVRVIKLENVGQEILENIEISFSDELKPYLELPIDEIETLDVGEDSEIGLYFASSVDEKVIEGQLKAQTESGVNTYSAVTLIYLRDYNLSEAEKEGAIIQSCSELGGVFCEESETCSDELTPARDGMCCKEYCEIEEGSSLGKWLGWILLIVLVVAVAWFFFKKYKGVKSKPNLPFKPKFSRKPELPKRQIVPKADKEMEKNAMAKLQDFKRRFSKDKQ